MLQPWDTMSLIKADLGLVCGRVRSTGSTRAPQENHHLSPFHEPLHWRAQCDPKATNLSLQILSTEGRVVGLGWARLKPKAPKGSTKLLNQFRCLVSAYGET